MDEKEKKFGQSIWDKSVRTYWGTCWELGRPLENREKLKIFLSPQPKFGTRSSPFSLQHKFSTRLNIIPRSSLLFFKSFNSILHGSNFSSDSRYIFFDFLEVFEAVLPHAFSSS